MRKRKILEGWVNSLVYPSSRPPLHQLRINADGIRFCDCRRHALCAQDGRCSAMDPQCTNDELRLIGVRPFSARGERLSRFNNRNRSFIERKVNDRLAKFFAGCKPIRVEVWR